MKDFYINTIEDDLKLLGKSISKLEYKINDIDKIKDILKNNNLFLINKLNLILLIKIKDSNNVLKSNDLVINLLEINSDLNIVYHQLIDEEIDHNYIITIFYKSIILERE